MAVDSIPNPSVDLVRISAALTSHSEVSFLISLTLPGHSDPVSALIDSGATSNFLDSSLATSPPFVLEPLDRPIPLCLFNGKPATAGFIHESVNTSILFADHLTQSLSLLVTKLHPSAPIVLGLPWLRSTNPTIDWLALSLTFKTGSQSALPSLAWARACSTAALRHEDIISDMPPVFDSIPELCYFFRTFDPDQGGPDLKTDVFCQVGAILVKLCTPSWIYTLELTQIHPTQTHALVGSVVALVFRIRQILSDRGWGLHPSYDLSLARGGSC